MKKILIVAFALASILLTTGIASAHGRIGFGFFFGPPVVVAPAPVYNYYPYYRPYPYPGSYYGYDYDYRVWIPGHWQEIRDRYGWRRAWVPGHWRYRY